MEAASDIKGAEDPRSTAELLALARSQQTELDAEDDDRWEAIRALYRRATPEVFHAAEQLCRSADALERRLAAEILAQFGYDKPVFLEESVSLLIPLLSDPCPEVIAAAASALGHRGAPSAIPYLLSLISHPDNDVRFGVMAGLSGQDDPRAIAGLIELSRDVDADVRNWATFGLGQQTEADTPELREALLARTLDENHDARGEALMGLAVRRDPRVIEPIIRELAGKYYGTYAVEAAELFPHPEFHAHLLPLRSSIEKHHSWCLEGYENALTACRPPDGTLSLFPTWQDEEGQES